MIEFFSVFFSSIGSALNVEFIAVLFLFPLTVALFSSVCILFLVNK